ncbi:MAG: hypothetical protein Kow00107_04500 [Planctomycetota bacterium]
MSEKPKKRRPTKRTWLDDLLEEMGIPMPEVDPPEGFCRVVFPRSKRLKTESESNIGERNEQIPNDKERDQ